MSHAETHWELRKNNMVLGTLVAYTWDFPWIDCDFQPTPAGEEYRALFTDQLQPLVEQAGEDDEDAWETAYHQLESMAVVFVPVSETARDLMFDLFERAGDKVWFDAIFADK
ncbi:MAG: hypothetical protein GYB65_00680 [Chloroflexi bacterium]|nr:hypothetical protein [Chloroflexota bacterium]